MHCDVLFRWFVVLGIDDPVRVPKRRSAIEPEIGHMKTDGRLSRCLLKGTSGDAIFAVLCGCGHNIRKILAHLRTLITAIQATVPIALGPRIYRLNDRIEP